MKVKFHPNQVAMKGYDPETIFFCDVWNVTLTLMVLDPSQSYE